MQKRGWEGDDVWDTRWDWRNELQKEKRNSVAELPGFEEASECIEPKSDEMFGRDGMQYRLTPLASAQWVSFKLLHRRETRKAFTY